MPKKGTAPTDVKESIERWFADVQLVAIGPRFDGIRGVRVGAWRRAGDVLNRSPW